MTPLNWKEAPATTEQAHQPTDQRANPWFGVAMALVGLIAGFVIRRFI